MLFARKLFEEFIFVFLAHYFVLSICMVIKENICGSLILLYVLFGSCQAQDNFSTGPAADYNLNTCSMAQGVTVVGSGL